MEIYLRHLPYFLIFTLSGIIVNLSNKKRNKENISIWRFIEEFFGSLWISALVLSGLEYFTQLPPIIISGIGSIAGFFHSKIIDWIGNDLLVILFKTIKSKVINKTNKNE